MDTDNPISLDLIYFEASGWSKKLIMSAKHPSAKGLSASSLCLLQFGGETRAFTEIRKDMYLNYHVIRNDSTALQ